MTFNNIFQFMVPKDKQFFPLFAKSTSNLVEIAKAFKDLSNSDTGTRDSLHIKIATLSDKNQNISKEISLELVKSFLTPFDKEDIHMLVVGIDKISSNIAKASKKMKIYKVNIVSDAIKKLADVNLQAVNNITDGITKLENTKKIESILAKAKELETTADSIHNDAIEALFEKESDGKTLIMNKEIISALETVTDKCKNVADVLELIVVKHT
jgi:uncharacterized protein